MNICKTYGINYWKEEALKLREEIENSELGELKKKIGFLIAKNEQLGSENKLLKTDLHFIQQKNTELGDKMCELKKSEAKLKENLSDMKKLWLEEHDKNMNNCYDSANYQIQLVDSDDKIKKLDFMVEKLLEANAKLRNKGE